MHPPPIGPHPPLPWVRDRLQNAAGYQSVGYLPGGPWPGSDFLTALFPSTHVFYSGHGRFDADPDGPGPLTELASIEDGIQEVIFARHNGHPEWPASNSLDDCYDVKASSTNWFPTGPISDLPPFNNGEPPVGIAILAACDIGQTNAFSSLLYPWRNWYNPYTCENQALFSHKGDCLTNPDNFAVRALYDSLLNGDTILEAREEYIQTYNLYYWWWTGNDTYIEYTPIYGDQFARLHGVYTGSTDIPEGFWYSNDSNSSPPNGGP